MKNIKAALRSNFKNKDNESLIYIRYTYNRKYVLFRTDVYVKPFLFNTKSGRVKKSPNYELKNQILRQKEVEVESLVLQLIAKGVEPTLFNVKQKYLSNETSSPILTQKSKKVQERKFLMDFQRFIDYRKEFEQISAETIKTYTTTLNKLKDFQKDKQYLVDYPSITKEFYDRFLMYLYDNGLIDNSVDKHIKNLKVFMKYALSKNWHNNNEFLSFKRTRTKTDFAVLDAHEIRKLYNYTPEKDNLKHVRDTFLLGITTGLRFSDLSKLTQGNFVIHRKASGKIDQNPANSYIRLQIQKTNDYLKIPINNFICYLIDEYKIEESPISFNKISNQKFNEHIKTVCEKAGITSVYKVSKKKGTEQVVEEKFKFEFISSHTMRRSFISLLSHYTSGTNIQSVSGHKDIKVLTDYIKHSDDELELVSDTLNGALFNHPSKPQVLPNPN